MTARGRRYKLADGLPGAIVGGSTGMAFTRSLLRPAGPPSLPPLGTPAGRLGILLWVARFPASDAKAAPDNLELPRVTHRTASNSQASGRPGA
jgi:hypothetical protein